MAVALAVTACSDGHRPTAPPSLTSSSTSGPVADPQPTPVETAPIQDTLGQARGAWKDTGVFGDDPIYMRSVAAPGPRDAWAVGSAADESAGIVKHWDGRRWRSVKPPGKNGRNGLEVVSALSSSDVWVFGQDGDVWRREGVGWSHKGRPGRIANLNDAVVIGPREVWVAGRMDDESQSPVVARWSGASWVTVPAPFAGEVTSLSADSRRQLWAMGVGADNVPAVARWDGERWQALPLPDRLHSQQVTLKRIVAASPGKAWIAGVFHIRDSKRYEPGFVMYWNGRDWQSLDAPSPDAFQPPGSGIYSEFGTIVSDGRGGLWLGDEHGRIWHYDGRKWWPEKTPPDTSWFIASDFASIPGSRRAIAVGSQPEAEEDSVGWIWLRHPIAVN